ncbi:MAG: polyphenol oxidase family protein [Thermoleophilia bacterium]
MTPRLIRPPVDGPAAAAFTTRVGGASTGPYAQGNLCGAQGDDPAAVRANRAAVCAELGLDPLRVSVNAQVHGTAVRAVGDAPAGVGFADALTGWPQADGLVTRHPGCGLVVLGADCVPVLLWRRDTAAVAATHAGWRGLVGGVLTRALEALGDPGRVGAAVGAGIGPCCFRVGAEVREVFTRRFGPAVVVGEQVDLAGAVGVALREAGVPAGAIWTMDTCTVCDGERWFSHRRDAGVTGRQAGIIWPL